MNIVQVVKTEPVSNRWKRQYLNRLIWSTVMLKTHTGSAKIIYDKIVEIETKADPDYLDQIDIVIGNTAWTHHSCNECGLTTRDPLIEFYINGGEYSHDLCITCVKKALKLLKEAK